MAEIKPNEIVTARANVNPKTGEPECFMFDPKEGKRAVIPFGEGIVLKSTELGWQYHGSLKMPKDDVNFFKFGAKEKEDG